MNHEIQNSIVNFLLSIADDVLRDVYVHGKYRDVIDDELEAEVEE